MGEEPACRAGFRPRRHKPETPVLAAFRATLEELRPVRAWRRAGSGIAKPRSESAPTTARQRDPLILLTGAHVATSRSDTGRAELHTGTARVPDARVDRLSDCD